jgi:hypothetical protein
MVKGNSEALREIWDLKQIFFDTYPLQPEPSRKNSNLKVEDDKHIRQQLPRTVIPCTISVSVREAMLSWVYGKAMKLPSLETSMFTFSNDHILYSML